MYYLSEDESGKSFYASCDDVTEIQFLNSEIPGGYFRCIMDEALEFLYVSENFQRMVGYTADEIRVLFDNRLINMIHPKDLSIVLTRLPELRSGRYVASPPYRLKCKSGDYIYVVVQTIATDISGDISLLSIATDVTDILTLRDQVHLLSRYFSDTVVFLRRTAGGQWQHFPVINGLEAKLGLDIPGLQRAMDEGGFYRRFDPERQAELLKSTMAHMRRREPFEFDCDYLRPDAPPLPLHFRMDRVNDPGSTVEYICIMREAPAKN